MFTKMSKKETSSITFCKPGGRNESRPRCRIALYTMNQKAIVDRFITRMKIEVNRPKNEI